MRQSVVCQAGAFVVVRPVGVYFYSIFHFRAAFLRTISLYIFLFQFNLQLCKFIGISVSGFHIFEKGDNQCAGVLSDAGRKEEMSMNNTILQLFPASQRSFWQQTAAYQREIQEIRLRAYRPIAVHKGGRELFLNQEGVFTDNPSGARCISPEELEGLLKHICSYSLYAFEDELRQGFITVSGGHRVGVAGQVVLEDDGRIRSIKNISFINLRISHEVKGAADGVIPYMYSGERLMNALIISPPGCGKTTLLRDLIRQISDGNAHGRGMTVGVVDERSELAGSFCGIPQNDLVMRTDVLDACPKEKGMFLLLRSMSPRVVAIDELGSREELDQLKRAQACGCRILATAHGEGIEDVERRFDVTKESWAKLFDLSILLGKVEGRCVVRKILKWSEISDEVSK